MPGKGMDFEKCIYFYNFLPPDQTVCKYVPLECFVEGSTPSLIAAFFYDVLKIATAGKAISFSKENSPGKTPKENRHAGFSVSWKPFYYWMSYNILEKFYFSTHTVTI